jgi:hypothetical protein
MKTSKTRYTFVLSVWVLAVSNLSGFAFERILTANDGRTLHARLIAKTDETVEIIRSSDRRWFEISLETLSEADREFIRNWVPVSGPEWAQEPFGREMVQPVEGFETLDIRRSRRPARAIFHPSPMWIHGGGYSHVSWPQFHDHGQFHRGCFRRPIISVNIR